MKSNPRDPEMSFEKQSPRGFLLSQACILLSFTGSFHPPRNCPSAIHLPRGAGRSPGQSGKLRSLTEQGDLDLGQGEDSKEFIFLPPTASFPSPPTLSTHFSFFSVASSVPIPEEKASRTHLQPPFLSRGSYSVLPHKPFPLLNYLPPSLAESRSCRCSPLLRPSPSTRRPAETLGTV